MYNDFEIDDYFDMLNEESVLSFESLKDELFNYNGNEDCDGDCSFCPNCHYCSYNN